jgi:hypothetical protein
MPAMRVRASTILGEFEQAQTELVGKAVILTDGKVGTVESVWLDEIHGFRISIRATMESGLSPPSIRADGLKFGFSLLCLAQARPRRSIASREWSWGPVFDRALIHTRAAGALRRWAYRV